MRKSAIIFLILSLFASTLFAAGIRHQFVSPKADGPDNTIVRPSNWNAEHVADDNSINGSIVLDNSIASVKVVSLAWAKLTGVPTTLSGYGITDAAPIAHVSDTANPHAVTKAQVGLGAVENTALSTWPGSANITTLGTISSGAVPWTLVSGKPTFGTLSALDNGTMTDTKACIWTAGVGVVCNSTLGTAAATASSDYAVAAKGVTGGDSHDHAGGDGAQIAYSGLSGLPTLAATEAGAANNFLTAYNATTGAFSKAQPTDANLSTSDVTTNDASTTKHGFAPKAVAPAANELNVLGIGNGETAYTNKDLFDTTNPAAVGTAAPGTQVVAARRDHVHAASHTAIADIGTNTHAQVDTHLASTSNPHTTTAAQVGLGAVDNTSDATKNSATATLTNKMVALTEAPGTDNTATGIIAVLTAGENLVPGNVVYFKSDGKVWKADANAAGAYPCMGIAIATINANATGNILLHGIVRSDQWTWTVGGVIYLSTTAGAMTQTQPAATDDVIQIIGIATHADRMFFRPDLSWITHT